MQTVQEQSNAPTLVAIAIAARKAGDRDLERYARGQLQERHGVKLTFAGRKGEQSQEGRSDDR